VRPGNSKQIFIDAARPDTILHGGMPSFRQHAWPNDGTAMPSEVFDGPSVVGRDPKARRR
jgi:hypothetical protein